ncbi:XRE family transcriptional regulator [Burkholderia stagnalis]|uniref:XRE family transcriptional regulator n=1 Tax=Burkholderia stagnalis TaxID=1503054 RepID=A0ABX9YPK2_9BURK|nr:XRE family transcriptional regulator [Burkholderia stagnalis]MDY7802006.1 XRE family transcriptional regulator [Burkholderia stagnalis]RQQ10537.1 XRE family transcriptional regulator [Burkholderia stagnalis]RQQ10733.1 XRE family transcriptional regulator [Burkholderia stagnalis]RQQ37702.1 XRE family transcriptional regulator [Burkholderia stagnalis]RQQ51179.1 XRE family transcriptional regulator [Burkholderia stagnalis]
MYTMLDNVDQRVGARIRTERENRGWSLTNLAEKSGVSRAMIHKIERGESSPTASLLAKLAGAFGLTMSALLALAELEEGRLLRAADQPLWIDPQSGYVRRHVSPKSASPLNLVEIDLPPATEIPMPASAYLHARQLIWMLDGELVFIEGGTRHELAVGDCLELGPPSDCVFRNESARSCKYAVILVQRA